VERPGEEPSEGERRGDPRARDECGAPDPLADEPHVELDADEEHVEDEADLRDREEDRHRGLREEVRARVGPEPAEEGRPHQDAGDHLADDLRLPHLCEEPRRRLADGEDDEELQEEPDREVEVREGHGGIVGATGL